jgi:hypothetical protein
MTACKMPRAALVTAVLALTLATTAVDAQPAEDKDAGTRSDIPHELRGLDHLTVSPPKAAALFDNMVPGQPQAF